MEELTIQKAKSFAYEKLEKLPILEKKFLLIHSKYVIEAIKELAKEKKIIINFNDIEIAAWLHDIGYIISEENHAEHSLKICLEKFKINDTIKDCILNHGIGKNPLTKEGKITQLADKLSFFYKEFRTFYLEANILEGNTREQAEQKLKMKLEKHKKQFSDKEYQKIIKRLL